MPDPGALAAGVPVVTVTGSGSASAVPDTALLTLGVETKEATPAEAFEACRRLLDQVLEALDAEGVEPARRTTTALELQEDWESRQAGAGPVGYRAATRLTVRLDDPAGAGRVAAAAVNAGGEAARVHGLELVVGDQAAVAAAAREAAWRDAEARAAQFAGLAGATLGRVLQVRDVPPPPDVRPMRLAADALAGPAVEPGEASISAAVAVTWALEPAGQAG
jgi:uncharacterized protein YggE